MRFPERLAAFLAAALVATPCLAQGPEAVRSEIAAALKERLPSLAAQDYSLGAAALDGELRRAIEENAGASVEVVAAGKALWTRKFKNGRTLSGCFPNGGRRVAASYPQFDPRVKRVITLEMAVNQCLKAHGEALFDHDDPKTMGAVTAYLRSLSDGQKLSVRVRPEAEAQFEQGRRLYFSRLGQRNFACASCHVQGAGKRYSDTPLSPVIGQAAHWPVIRGGVPVTLHQRIRECLGLMGAAPFPAGSEELNTIEYFLAYLSNGYPLGANAWRPPLTLR
jgi:L-cysteine S-thiosulfotransferase